MRAALVGFGSIGKRHLKELSQRSDEVAVFDINLPDSDLGNIDKNAIFFADWTSFAKKVKNYDLAVIATWGPTHESIFAKMAELEIKSILVEKPLESSVKKIDSINQIAKNHRIRVFENFHFRYSQIQSTLRMLESRFNLGPLLQLNVSGGAKCLSTTGVHYLDLCEWIKNERPNAVIADLESNFINPRSETLLVYGGLASWSYPSGFKLTMNFSNSSYSDATIEFLWKNAKGRLTGSTLELFGPENFPYFDPFSTARVKTFGRLLNQSEVIQDSEGRDGMSNLYDAFFDLKEEYRNPDFGSSTRDLISALISSQEASKVNTEEFPENYYENEWLIS
jgi:predicted dehydrogenase